MDRFLFCLAITTAVVVVSLPSFSNADSVLSYGAFGDGVQDDTVALQKAWKDACDGTSKSTVVSVPTGKVFNLQPITLSGPCKPSIVSVVIDGQIKAPSKPTEWRFQTKGNQSWIMFENVSGLRLSGKGLLDGQGKPWWDIHCRDHPGPGCTWLAPTMVTFQSCNNVNLTGLKIRNSPQTHVLVYLTKNVQISNTNISSPGNSPNTDGVHIAAASGVAVIDSDIASGDDCVSIGDKTSNINVTNVNCGPGHGVSVGSLGRNGTDVAVENISVKHVNFTGTQNGARIKTWREGTGYVRNVEFTDLIFTSVQNPIVIDQHYGCKPNSCWGKEVGVHIDQVSYIRAKGTSVTEAAINLNCSINVPCTNIVLDSVQLTAAAPATKVNADCYYAHGTAKGTVLPPSCLSS